MGEKDSSEKLLEDYADIFADICNVLAFHGETLLREEDLFPGPTESIYKAESGELHQQFRDVMKYDRRGKALFSIIGLENQTSIDKDLVFRIMKYDAASYQYQIESGENYRRPVFTLVLYFGNKRWSGPKTIMDAIKTDDLPYGNYVPELLSDIKLNVVEVSFLPLEVRKQFKSDFRIVADFFCAMREGRDKDFRSTQAFRHVREMLEFFRVFTQDKRFGDCLPQILEKAGKGESISMCTVLDYAEDKGRQEGLQKGLQKGLQEGLQEGRQEGVQEEREKVIMNALKAGFPIVSIMKLGYSEEIVRSVADKNNLPVD